MMMMVVHAVVSVVLIGRSACGVQLYAVFSASQGIH